MKNIFSSRRNKSPHNKEETEKKEAPFFSKEGKVPFFNNLKGAPVQAKLTVGQPGDKYEKEADSMADAVVNKTATSEIQQKEISSIQRESLATPLEDEKLGTAEQRMEEDKLVQEKPEIQRMEEPEEEMLNKMEDEDEEAVQTKSNGKSSTASPGLTQQIKSKTGKGKSLSKSTQAEMESSFKTDFSDVNIHTDQEAVKMNKELGAQAFTHGKDVYFNSGKYNPDSSQGKHLLAHELTHVVQQNPLTIQKKDKKTKPNSTSASKKNNKKRNDLIDNLIGTMNVNKTMKNRIVFASKAFSINQLNRMKKAGVRFWQKGKSPDYLKNARMRIVFKTKRGGKAFYWHQGRTIAIDNKSNSSDIRHELAHAWDHIVNVKSKGLVPLETMSEKRLIKELNIKKPMRSQNNKEIRKAFDEYRNNLGLFKKTDINPRKVALENFAFDNPLTESGHSVHSIADFYAEGYSVFHGTSEEKKAKLLNNAPRLYKFLEKEADKQKLPVPDKENLKNQ